MCKICIHMVLQEPGGPVGYLAQHTLFDQVSNLVTQCYLMYLMDEHCVCIRDGTIQGTGVLMHHAKVSQYHNTSLLFKH